MRTQCLWIFHFWTIPNAATMWLVTAQFKSVWTSCSRRTSIGLSFLESIEAWHVLSTQYIHIHTYTYIYIYSEWVCLKMRDIRFNFIFFNIIIKTMHKIASSMGHIMLRRISISHTYTPHDMYLVQAAERPSYPDTGRRCWLYITTCFATSSAQCSKHRLVDKTKGDTLWLCLT